VPDEHGGSSGRVGSLEAEIDLTRAAKPFRDARFMVVDDDPAIVALVSRVLRMSGATEVHEVTDATQVLPRYEAHRPDLVLLDLHLGHLDGQEILEQLRAAGDDRLAVVVLSGETSDDVRDRVVAAGAQDYLIKPFDLPVLLQRLRTVLAARAARIAST
jgi:DNA-binding response OmpR family regulator